MHSPPEAQVGPYRLLRELGRGAMGAVYLAQHERLMSRVALKVMLSGFGDVEARARFGLEAQVGSKLVHPGIVRVQDVGLHAGLPYLVMEYCPGESLDALLKREGSLPPRKAARLVAQIARAVGFAHSQGVLHRDLKPANVILSQSDGAPRVTDFGLARDRTLQQTLTRTGDVLGTPSYMAPEQFQGRKDIDPRADVYSLGVILYRCLTGQRPYEAPSVYRLMEAVCAGDCPAPTTWTDVPPELERICLRALARARAERYADGGELAEALEAWIYDGESAPASRITSWRAAAMAAALAGVGLGGTLWAIPGGAVGSPGPPALAAHEVEPEPQRAPDPEPEPQRAPDPEPEPRASPGELAPLESWVLGVFFGEPLLERLPSVREELEVLRARYPNDSRLTILHGMVRLPSEEAEPLSERRRWQRALMADPPPSDVLAGLAARLNYALGFHRAASDAIRERVAGGAPADWAVHTAVEHHLLTRFPVRDDAFAERLARGLLERRAIQPAGTHGPDLPDRDTILAYRAVARAAQGDVEGAALELERDAAGSRVAGLASRLRRARRVEAEDFVDVSFGLCEALARFEAARKKPLEAPDRFAKLAERMHSRGRADYAALACVAGARYAFLLRDSRRGLALLERAAGLELSAEARDVRCLVARQLGRALLESDPARAERLGVEAAAPWGGLEGRTVGERADAWLLVARARRRLGDRSGAREALDRAASVRPRDTRELEALRRGD